MRKVLLAAFAVIVSMSASAQLISSNTMTTMTTPKKKADGYTRWSISYNSLSMDKKIFDESLTGISLAWTKGLSISSDMPLYVESGIGLTYAFNTETVGDSSWGGDSYDMKNKYLGLTVPLNVTYKYTVPNTSIKVAPFAGIYLRGNILGETSHEDDGDTWDWYEEPYEGYGAARLSIGWQIGAGLEYNRLYFGLSYGNDINNFIDIDDGPYTTIKTFSATLGITL